MPMSSSDFEFFIYLCQAGSISQAARELDITPAAASKRLSSIEKAVGCQLLSRSTRSMSLTHNGRIYLDYARKVTTTIEDMNKLLRQQSDEAEGLIRINAPFGFGRRYVSRFVADFIEENPKVECQLHLSDHPLNLIANSFDIGIRFGTLPDSGLHARKIASHQRFVCASPSYLSAHGEPRHPHELSSHNCIVLRQNEDTYGNWRFSKEDQVCHVRVRGNLSSNDGESVLSWALRGQGIAIRAEWDVYYHLKDGSLRRILDEYELPNADIYAVYPYSQNLPARIRLLIDYFAERMKIVPFNR
ncbi:LysR family transcriptional regulator [Halomonas daqingensis]|nr:LysR family transcriptional regulator [Halomonas desiderata]